MDISMRDCCVPRSSCAQPTLPDDGRAMTLKNALPRMSGPRARVRPLAPWVTVDQMLDDARRILVRVTPAGARAAQASGAVLIDIRSELQRFNDGEVPGATRYPRNVLEWRLDPSCEHRDPDVARRDVRLILLCDEGFQSSLVAAAVRRFGLDATDVIGGFQAWRADGLAVEPGRPADPGS